MMQHSWVLEPTCQMDITRFFILLDIILWNSKLKLWSRKTYVKCSKHIQMGNPIPSSSKGQSCGGWIKVSINGHKWIRGNEERGMNVGSAFIF